MIMGKMIISGGGGSGAGSDECTASNAEVLKGYKAITSDSADEVVEGTLELTGDVSDSQVLEGKTYYNSNPKIKRTGSMVNHGAVSLSLNAGASYMVPAGFHNGGGKVTANSLASQTSATATAAQIINGQTAWVNGSKLTGTLSVNSILSFSAAAYSTTQILLQWQNPYAAAGKPFSGVFINYSTSGYPGAGGTRIYTGYGNNATPGGWSQAIVTMPTMGTTYYFSATAYASGSPTDMWGNTLNAVATTTSRGQQAFNSSTTFTVPAGVRSIDIFCVGGGGGGAGGTDGNAKYAAGGGGSGYTSTVKGISVAPGQQLTVTIGAGGARSDPYFSGKHGGETKVTNGTTTLVSAQGGKAGDWSSSGVSGGSSGGVGAFVDRNHSVNAQNGGSDGGNALGQKTTTRAFGEYGNTLYAGGGGGGGSGQRENSNRGYGGAGGGGNGADAFIGGSDGTTGTGGGGGGGYHYSSPGIGFAGGSGICLIRWGY